MNENEVILNLKLSVAEINTVLKSLGKHPFEEIAVLVSKIKQQGETQLAALTAEPAKE